MLSMPTGNVRGVVAGVEVGHISKELRQKVERKVKRKKTGDTDEIKTLKKCCTGIVKR
jgi:hypothetical protein